MWRKSELEWIWCQFLARTNPRTRLFVRGVNAVQSYDMEAARRYGTDRPKDYHRDQLIS